MESFLTPPRMTDSREHGRNFSTIYPRRGPFLNHDHKVFTRTQQSNSALVGLTESKQGMGNNTQWHYQSFFYTLKRSALQHPGVQKYWLDGMFSLATKTEIIQKYELGMAQHITDLGLSFKSRRWAYRCLLRRGLCR